MIKKFMTATKHNFKRIACFTTIFYTALVLNSGLTAYAAENLNRDDIETEIWADMWNGKDDNGLDFPEASYKHHLLDEWLEENYGSDDYDWTDLGELKYQYKDYYRRLVENWDFEDDNEGNWTIDTEDNHYSFYLLNGVWQMINQNGDTVDTFPPFSTLEEESETANSYVIDDNGADSPRVIGNVTGGAETASEAFADGEGNTITADSSTEPSEGNSEDLGVNPLAIFAGVVAVAGIGGAGYYIMKKKK